MMFWDCTEGQKNGLVIDGTLIEMDTTGVFMWNENTPGRIINNTTEKRSEQYANNIVQKYDGEWKTIKEFDSVMTLICAPLHDRVILRVGGGYLSKEEVVLFLDGKVEKLETIFTEFIDGCYYGITSRGKYPVITKFDVDTQMEEVRVYTHGCCPCGGMLLHWNTSRASHHIVKAIIGTVPMGLIAVFIGSAI